MTAPPDHPFLAACRGEPTSHTPVWFMRQAGRHLPEYRKLRGEGSILQAVADPELAAQITLQPVRRYGVDAAILFSDIVVPVAALGFGVDVAPGVGPVVERPFAGAADLDRLRMLDPEADTPYVAEAVRLVTAELGDTTMITSRPRLARRSALVGEWAPPSTYFRPSMATGANTPGMADDASTAVATSGCGTGSRPKTARWPSLSRRAQIHNGRSGQRPRPS